MQDIIDKIDDIIERFDEDVPIGMRFHTLTKEDFLDLAKCVKRIAEKIQSEGLEID